MITVTGASGKTGHRVAEQLIARGEVVRVIGRDINRLKPLVAKGADPYVGNQGDLQFLTNAFTNADAAYVLIPPKLDTPDLRGYQRVMGGVITRAVENSGLRKLVFLSSLGAEMDFNTGPILGLHDAEDSLSSLITTDIVILRASYFYENLLQNIAGIRDKQIISGATEPDALIPMVDTRDIALKATELLASRNFTGHQVMELCGQTLSMGKAARIIGNKIGILDLAYLQISGKQAIEGMMEMGISKSVAEAFLEMARAFSAGRIVAHRPESLMPTGYTKFAEFVDDIFVPAYFEARESDRGDSAVKKAA